MERATTGRTPDGRLSVDFHARQAVADGRVLQLTYGDCRLLLGLIEQGDEFRGARDIGDRVWNFAAATGHEVGVRLNYLRAKLGRDWVETTVRGHRLGRPPLPGEPAATRS
ncbi:hypothetical protein ABZW10_37775 [Kitasatospora sp. NPDC004723]|uniref:hypothetical protein n=1 Tax=Kitasatospora sp. NPDC004723 TaxID=3154288 RepID=UPI00339F0893